MGTEFEKGNAQENSSFFTKLPPELRRLIFIYLFGESTVHIKFHQSKDQFKREGRPKPSKVPGWCHCVCRKGKGALPHQHSEKDHKWCQLSANVMFTCKWAFQSGLHVLYDYAMFSSWVTTKQKYIKWLQLYLRHNYYDNYYVDFYQLAALMPHTSLKENVEVRIDVHHLLSIDNDAGFIYDVADKMLDGLKGFLYALNQSSVSMLDLYLPGTLEFFVEMGEKRDWQAWQKTVCHFEHEPEDNSEEEGPESDDENYGLVVFPTRGDF
ncbi:uncharacterized protein FMAN_10510 [Fusarium mangiferae]|uniref:DUF7730 domain-containing protein n=1 Tax=Fusarium mangiferae TaxID=192010 RepID=A0A1L7U4Y6_FUSMA|nr:uncharacterized protein FMAN_10510 [Fusarium mangiferae]CVL05830.1 uncharacterized protein FMAN_10510 [Fusarium mangiferae]